MNLAGHEFAEEDLIYRVMLNLRPPRGQRSELRWVLVKNTFGVGSTVAHALCQAFDLDPDEVIK